MKDTIFEEGGRIYSSIGTIPETYEFGRKSGDLTVPYASLAHCHTWLGPSIQMTRIPQRLYFSEEEIGVVGNPSFVMKEKHADFTTSMEESSEPMITFYESQHITEDNKKWETAVWEIDGADHRGVIQFTAFLRELKEEFAYMLAKDSFVQTGPHHHHLSGTASHSGEILGDSTFRMMSSESLEGFAPKTVRIPRSDEDCVWDYYSAMCKFPEYCEYNYHFGDLTLDQSCRLRPKQSFQSQHVHHSHETSSKLEPCQCKTQCVSGFCEYVKNCEHATQVNILMCVVFYISCFH
jgi:hypothetical protein